MGLLDFFKLNSKRRWQQIGYVKEGFDYYDDVPRWVAERIDHDRKHDGFWENRYELEGMHYVYRITPDRSGEEPIIIVERKPR